MLHTGLQGNYQVIPNVVNTNIFTEHPKDIPLKKKILHISSFQDGHKNISGIIRVIKKLSVMRQDFSLHCITNGNQKPFIEQAEKLKILNSYVFFHGGKTTEEIAEFMQQSELLILFSNYENLPCVILEALSCELPVVSTDVGDISRYVSEKFGTLVKAGDEEGLLNAIDSIFDNLEQYDGKMMHEYVEKNFSYPAIGKKFHDIYSEVLNK